MEVKDLLTLYGGDSYIDVIHSQISSREPEAGHVQIKGLVGSLDAVIAAAIQQKKKNPALYVLSDREEAAYFQNDLQNLLGDSEVLFYPTSYKRPYHYEEVDNANVLMRGEILNKLSASRSVPLQVVTYPEALFEKVINKRSLKANTFSVKVGEKLDTTFLTEFLNNYGF